jgi:hypothetical protein
MTRKSSTTDLSTDEPTLRPGRRRAAALATATAAASVASVVALAAPASASTACHDLAFQSASRNVLGQVTHGVTNEIYWCGDASTGKISYVKTLATHQESYLWNWVGWNGNYKLGGVGYGSFTYSITGTFKECAAYCFNSASNTVRFTVYANGGYTVTR